MDIFFSDPAEIPLPPAEVRIRELRVEPGPDLDRVRVYLELDPFQRKPNLDIALFDLQGNQLLATSIIESMVRKMEFNMLFRRKLEPGNYRISASLYYVEIEQPEVGDGTIDRQQYDTRDTIFWLG